MATLKFHYQFVDFPPLPNVYSGTGYVNYSPWLADPPSVADVSKPLVFKNPECRIVVLCLTIAPPAVPNWFAIVFQQGIKSFTSVNIFFHPTPTQKMEDVNYLQRTGGWPSLFRYAQILGFGFGAGNCDQILLIPFFNHGSYWPGGIFTSNWSEILLVAINAVRSVKLWQGPPATGGTVNMTTIAQGALIELQRGDVTPIEVKDVVLSCFSVGRVPMLNFRSRATPSVDAFLREIWDFDGVRTPLPAVQGNYRSLPTTSQQATIPRAFMFR